MRPFSSAKKPLEPGISTHDKKAVQQKQLNETDGTKKLASSQSTRLLNNLTSHPISKRVNSPVSPKSPRSLQRCPEATSLSPRSRQQNFGKSPTKNNKTQNNKIGKDIRVFGNEEEGKIGKDFWVTEAEEDEYAIVGSTKNTDKESNNCSVIIDEEERERERLMDRLGVCGVRSGRRATLKHKEMFEQLNSSFNQDEKKISNKQFLKVPIPEREYFDNNKATVIITKTPTRKQKTRDEEYLAGNSETESGEQSFERSEDKNAMSDIWNDTPRPEKSVELKTGKGKSKINLELYMSIENLLRDAKTAFYAGDSLMGICGEYIYIVPNKDLESYEKIFKNEESKVIKSSFVLERLAVVLVLYFTEELKIEQSIEELIRILVDVIYENYVLFGYLLSQKIQNDDMEYTLTEKLLELAENEEDIIINQERSIKRLYKNNSILSNTMKNILMTLQNKEVMYGYNSIIVQSDRISTKEAYTRMLKCLSVYASEKELKGQDPKAKLTPRQRNTEKTIIEPKSGNRTPRERETERTKEIKKTPREEPVSYYLPKLTGDKKYTLVLDLDETLVHFAEIPGHHNELRVRPYVEYFLTEVSKYYEVVIFTTGIQEYADWVLDNIDKHLSVSHRLYRHHASVDLETQSFIKDLSKLGRDLSHVLIVDNLSENFRLQPDNGIAIKPWYDDPEDNALVELAPLLVEIAGKKVRDVRVALRRFREQMIANIENGVENPHLNLNLEDCY